MAAGQPLYVVLHTRHVHCSTIACAAPLRAPGFVLPMKLLRSFPFASKTKVEGSVPSQAGSPIAVATGSGSGASSTTEGSASTLNRRRSFLTRARSCGLSMLTRSTATPLPGSVASVFRIRGNSSLQAPHQVAQKWRTTGFLDRGRLEGEEALCVGL